MEIINPTQPIATLTDGAKLEMEFRIEKGMGYVPVERGKEKQGALDFLQIDAVFMPVTKVNYSVENIRGERNEVKDSLMLEIWTNGSVNPKEALSQATEVLVNLFSPLKNINQIETAVPEYPDEENPQSQIPIEELQLSVRAYNCLKRAQINTVADLLDYSQEDLLEIKNFGQKSAEEVIEALQKRLGITLAQEKNKA